VSSYMKSSKGLYNWVINFN